MLVLCAGAGCHAGSCPGLTWKSVPPLIRKLPAWLPDASRASTSPLCAGKACRHMRAPRVSNGCAGRASRACREQCAISNLATPATAVCACHLVITQLLLFLLEKDGDMAASSAVAAVNAVAAARLSLPEAI